MDSPERPHWTFLSNHGHTLVFVALHPDARLRDIADSVGITERFAHSIVSDLVSAGYLTVERHGRRNSYAVNTGLKFRHPIESAADVGQLINIFSGLAHEPSA